VLVWRALRAQTDANVGVDIMARFAISPGGDDEDGERRLRYVPVGYIEGSLSSSQCTDAAGSQQRQRKCGECHHCQHPAWKRRCLGIGGSTSDAQIDFEHRKRRKEVRASMLCLGEQLPHETNQV